ncbi:MAG: 2-succinyl-5-enolpyruvyl-6-hydroxy-3-cyclohexene-1-carboxylic-acid synthase [Myxococcales bacterium]|nr:2-succinyl-5-enolpyruvyl-6-hydroxy-3-cyclohexene-1-carboxylic-acid synthase [Myxococcales bacterium]
MVQGASPALTPTENWKKSNSKETRFWPKQGCTLRDRSGHQEQSSGIRGLIDLLIQRGVTDFIVSPGSRSTPLVMASLERAELKLHAVADERAAAFYALGLRQGGRRPGLIATSGSAPCHWHPALAEAAASQLDLILLSADRPVDLRERGAPQTIDQRNLFAPQIDAFFEFHAKHGEPELVRLSHFLSQTPKTQSIHLNVPLAKPLALDDGPPPKVDLIPEPEQASGEMQTRQELDGPGLVLAGSRAHREDCADRLATFLQSTGSTLLAESASGLRHHPGLQGFQELTPPQTTPAWVLRMGHWPTATPWRNALIQWSDAGVPIIGIGPEAQKNPLQKDAPFLPGSIRSQLATLCAPSSELHTYLGPTRLINRRLPPEDRLLETLANCLEPDSILVLGNSLSVRRFDEAVRPGHGPEQVYCNRGVCGIDGQLAFTAGLAKAMGRRTTCLLGDVSLFHDLNSLQLLRESSVPVQVVVLNNGGGRIFDHLPATSTMSPADHRRFFQTPQQLDHHAIARLFQLPYLCVKPGESDGLKRWFETQKNTSLIELDFTAQ